MHNSCLVSRRSFLEEARIVASLHHPSIVQVLDCGVREEDETPFLVMNYAPNGTLGQRHPKGTAVPFPLLLLYVKKIASALQYAHDKRLIHRDIKPENMLIGVDDEILLSDFGIALISASSTSQSTKAAAGTVAYMAPEQIMGKPRTASDQYALGIVVYEWLCGDRPFRGNFTELCAQHLYAPPPSLHEKFSAIPSELDAIVLKALAKEPAQRYTSVQEFADALDAYYQQSGQAEIVIAEEDIATYISISDPEEDEQTAPRVEPERIVLVASPVLDAGKSSQRGVSPALEARVAPLLSEDENESVATVPLISSGEHLVSATILPPLEQTVNVQAEVPPAPILLPPRYPASSKRRRAFALSSLVLLLIIIGSSFAVVPQLIHATAGKAGSRVLLSGATITGVPTLTVSPTSIPTHIPSPTPPHKTPLTATATANSPVLIIPPTSVPVVVIPPTIAPTHILPTPTHVPTPTPIVVPTATPTPTPVPANLQASPSSNVDSFNNNCSGGDSHGGVVYLDSCSYTLSNAGGSTQVLNWTGSVNNSLYTLTPNSGSIAPGQTQSVTVVVGSGCPVSMTLTLIGSANTVQVPLICTQILVAPGAQNFSSSNCTHTANWTCVVTVSAYAQNGATTNWTTTSTNTNGTATGITFSPSGGSLTPATSVQVTITIPSASCPSTNSLGFAAIGGEADGFDNYLSFTC